MHRLVLVAMLSAICVATPGAQEALTTNQRDADLVQLASMYAKQYAPYEWKRDVIGFDLYRLTPWLQRVHNVDDLDFQDALIEYIASLNDAHTFISLPSNFSASLGFTVDIYDGKVLIDSVNRVLLPEAQYPFAIGDELVALDGQPVQAVIASFRKYAQAANPRSTDRLAASLITDRFQETMPHAPEVGAASVASVRLATGAVNNYLIPWAKSGIGLESQGPLPSPRRGNGRIFLPPADGSTIEAVVGGVGPALFRRVDVPAGGNTLPSYMDSLRPLLNVSIAHSPHAVLGFGARSPVFALPAGFSVRLGTQSSHFFFSGSYLSNGVRVGFLRIPSMAPPNATLALQQLDSEIAFFNANTDVLVVDVMRNPGGTVNVTEAFAQRLFPSAFRSVGFEIRATADWVTSIVNAVGSAQAAGAPPEIIENLRAIMNELIAAYNENRGRTAPVSLTTTGSLTLAPAPNAYAKPVLLLTDEMTASGGDMFAAIMQDNHRAPLFGMRTMGAGGSIGTFECTTFTEIICGITMSLMNRGVVISGTEYPPSPYIENVGVRPDIVVDYMTRANLVSAGAPFVQAFTDAAVNLAQATAVSH